MRTARRQAPLVSLCLQVSPDRYDLFKLLPPINVKFGDLIYFLRLRIDLIKICDYWIYSLLQNRSKNRKFLKENNQELNAPPVFILHTPPAIGPPNSFLHL